MALLFACSQLCINLYLLPITMQTVGVMLIGLLYARKSATQTIIVYLLLGAIGVPVFANFKSGWQPLCGLSGGYLWGFLIAVLAMTSIKPKLAKINIWYQLFNCLLGTTIILLCGFGWLAIKIGLTPALKGGIYPFIIPGIIKIILTNLIVHYLVLIKKILTPTVSLALKIVANLRVLGQ